MSVKLFFTQSFVNASPRTKLRRALFFFVAIPIAIIFVPTAYIAAVLEAVADKCHDALWH